MIDMALYILIQTSVNIASWEIMGKSRPNHSSGRIIQNGEVSSKPRDELNVIYPLVN